MSSEHPSPEVATILSRHLLGIYFHSMLLLLVFDCLNVWIVHACFKLLYVSPLSIDKEIAMSAIFLFESLHAIRRFLGLTLSRNGAGPRKVCG